MTKRSLKPTCSPRQRCKNTPKKVPPNNLLAMFSCEAIGKKTQRQRQYLVSVAFLRADDSNTALFEWQLAVTRRNLYLFWFQYFVIEAGGVGRPSLQFTWSAQKNRGKGWWQKISRCNEWVAYWRPAESRFGAYTHAVFL